VTVAAVSTQNQPRDSKVEPENAPFTTVRSEVRVPKAAPCARAAASEPTPNALSHPDAGSAWDAISTLNPRTINENNTTINGR